METKIYICDDEEGMVRYLRKVLQDLHCEVETFTSPIALLQAIERGTAEGGVLLLDIKMPEMDGLEVLQKVQASRPDLAVIMMTGHGTIDSAVEAIRLGAFDYLTKPFPEDRLTTAIRNSLERGVLVAENQALKRELHSRSAPGSIIFRSERFREVYEMALRVAASDVSVLILGESGTGKELIAGAIHHASPRAKERFLAINCGALTETLLESQLFGHVRGAFTGAAQAQKGFLEEAQGGTLFLDEVGELSPALQVKLLRVLQEGEFIPVGATRPKRADVRFIAATNRDLEEEVANGAFREDLYYRLNVFSLQTPALRERAEDVEPLAEHFLALAAARTGRPLRGISATAMTALRAYGWPGNVRELHNVVERGVILARGEYLSLDELPPKIVQSVAKEEVAAHSEPLTLRDAERIQIVRTLRQTGWNKSQASRILDITRRTLDRKIVEYELNPDS